MKTRRLTLLGALAVCGIVIAIKYLIKLPAGIEQKTEELHKDTIQGL